jgi:hypothetical protein
LKLRIDPDNLPARVNFLTSTLLCVALAVLPGCASLEKFSPFRSRRPPRAERVHPAPERVGVIVLVNEDARFALIDTTSGLTPAPGTALKVIRGETEVAVLHCGPVQKRQFVVADIATGTPSRGDLVFR